MIYNTVIINYFLADHFYKFFSGVWTMKSGSHKYRYLILFNAITFYLWKKCPEDSLCRYRSGTV